MGIPPSLGPLSAHPGWGLALPPLTSLFFSPRPLSRKASSRWALLLFLFPSPLPALQPISSPGPCPHCLGSTTHSCPQKEGPQVPHPLQLRILPSTFAYLCVGGFEEQGWRGNRGCVMMLPGGREGQGDDGLTVFAGLCTPT